MTSCFRFRSKNLTLLNAVLVGLAVLLLLLGDTLGALVVVVLGRGALSTSQAFCKETQVSNLPCE
jgi:hypothetical protein